MSAPTYTKSGTKASVSAKLSKDVFEVEVKSHDLLKQAYDTYLANGRLNLAVVKTRGQVRGSTIKPWRQKGTGRARVGSRYNPLWRGGGITFGPTGEENYTKKLNVRAKRTAVKQALSLASKENQIKVIETFDCKSGKVKPTVSLLSKIEATGNILLVVSVKNELVERATRNLSKIKVVSANYLNVYDIINADSVIIEKTALETINTQLGGSK